jgi:hypothetical protein
MLSANVVEAKREVLHVEDIFPQTMVKLIYKEVMSSRKCAGDDQFTYSDIVKTHDSKTYIISARHIPLSESTQHGKSNCNQCYGTGRKIMKIEKHRISNTDDFVMIAPVSLKDLTEEQKQAVIETEKAAKFWTVVLPCHCVVKNMLKKGLYILSNDMSNILVEISCTEKI